MWLPSDPPSAQPSRGLPHGWRDLVRQVFVFSGVYVAYQLVRGLVSTTGPYKPFGDATKVITLERSLHVFVEPSVQSWALRVHWLMDLADWTYLNAHYLVTPVALLYIYLRRNAAYSFVRNMFIIAMAIALVGYAAFPTAPPRLMPEWGFTDAISQFLHSSNSVDTGPAKLFVNFTAAVPSMHVCIAVMLSWPMCLLSRRWLFKLLWGVYPVWVTFVVIATGNHYLLDVVLGALTATVAALLAHGLESRAPAAGFPAPAA